MLSAPPPSPQTCRQASFRATGAAAHEQVPAPLNPDTTSASAPHLIIATAPEAEDKFSFTPPRSFNSITIVGPTVVKSSAAESIHGELYFYQHIPAKLAHIFPNLHWVSSSKKPVTFAIDREYGPTLSQLLVNNAFQTTHLRKLLKNLHDIHTCSTGQTLDRTLVYANYLDKVHFRHRKYESIYESLGLRYQNHFQRLYARLLSYEVRDCGLPVDVVHGDPVFTNVIHTTNGFKFIDMRGAQGGVETLCGDAVYDIAKVYQSLCGYDFVLAGVPLDGATADNLKVLHAAFETLVRELYPVVRFTDVQMITVSLFTSLIPLHEHRAHRQKFAAISKVLLSVLEQDRQQYNLQGSRKQHIVDVIVRELKQVHLFQ